MPQFGTSVADLFDWLEALRTSAEEVALQANELQRRTEITVAQREEISAQVDALVGRVIDLQAMIPGTIPDAWNPAEVFALSDAVAEEISALRVRVGLAPVAARTQAAGKTGVGVVFGVLAAAGVAALVWMFRSR